MTIYSIIPETVIFENSENTDYRSTLIKHDGIEMEVRFINQTQARIERIYSGNPNDYLRAEYTPGSLLNFAPGTTSSRS
ncbi:YlzJ-like family protein [Paenibacillus aurantius]|uniref:YlzJ-like family protein n=1 Tax=Paenibacillus aurantius TaxID=2918900 RepID=A0AA96LIU1_9BACL|nr:YlzJ-like family protein [Paenibacillus aurantius]WJH33305.1 YlzJ-like family protein [Paenibacillus sp. CC-CFT747]WNQ13788.1 YlzJ-like family protein [Paenibacillus aurantius]